MTNFEIILFDDYFLSPTTIEDAEAQQRAFSNKEITQYLASPRTDPYTLEDAKSLLRKVEELNKQAGYPLFWSIRHRQLPSNIGSISAKTSVLDSGLEEHLPDRNMKEPFALFGFYLDPKYHRKGIMSEALRVVIEEVYKKHRIRHFYGECFVGNIGSRKTFEKNGFKMVKFVKEGGIKFIPYQKRDIEIFELVKE